MPYKVYTILIIKDIQLRNSILPHANLSDFFGAAAGHRPVPERTDS